MLTLTTRKRSPGCLAWFNRFILDDAFISFRYARNLATGVGLFWNPGETVEGYTNFLWTILISAGIRFGVEPLIFTQLLGMVFFTCSLFLTYRLAETQFRSIEVPLPRTAEES